MGENIFMKKKFFAVMLTVIAAVIFSACGSPKKGETETVENPRYMKELNAADYVTLGEYKNLELEPEVTDEYLEGYIEFILQNSAVAVPVADRTTVETGDVVDIDYAGKLDGVAFEGGTGQTSDLMIGSGSFIDGFEDGCIGMEIGETRDVTATFPDPYQNNPDLSGKEAVFTVTLNSISVMEVPELTDEYVSGLGIEDCSTVDEYKAFVYDILLEQQSAALEDEDEKAGYAVEAAAANAEFEAPPEGMVDRMNETLLSNVTAYAQIYGADIGEYVSNAYGGSAEDYEATLRGQAEMMAQRYLMMQAIADAEDISVSDKELEEELLADAENYGYKSADEYKEVIDVEAYREYLITQKVMAFISDSATVKAAK